MIGNELTEAFDKYKDQKNKESDDLQKYEDKAREDVALIREDFHNNKDKVVDMMMDAIMNVKFELPRVVIGNFEENMA